MHCATSSVSGECGRRDRGPESNSIYTVVPNLITYLSTTAICNVNKGLKWRRVVYVSVKSKSPVAADSRLKGDLHHYHIAGLFCISNTQRSLMFQLD